MFTGLVAATARVLSLSERRGGALLSVERPAAFGDVAAGESIAVSGVCLTALAGSGGAAPAELPMALADRSSLSFELSPETLRRSALSRLTRGGAVNLERALAVGDRLGGHIVAGHVDATTEVLAVTPHGGFWTFAFALGPDWARYVVEKGSIALDGVSLTVSALSDRSLEVAVIPHTFQATTLGARRPGDLVNVEVDVLGKYVERLLGARQTTRDQRLEALLS